MRVTIDKSTATASLAILVALLFGCCPACGADYRDRVVHTVSRQLPTIPSVSVNNADKFLNDLKLSPFWKVDKNRNGDYEAHARCIVPQDDFDQEGRQFLFELFCNPTVRLPKNWRISNQYILGNFMAKNGFTSLSATIVFTKPTNVDFCREDGSITLKVHESDEKKISPNSLSTLAIRLSKAHNIYLLVHEQGQDTARTATFAKLPALMREVASVVALPARYRVAEQYKRFFETFFQSPLKEMGLKRLSGLQDIDAFYGYFQSKPNTSYEGINIRISHPLYCGGEGTQESERLREANCLGKPYYDGDWLFFFIEHNTVCVLPKYDKEFGTFSGKSSFEGTLEVLNSTGKVLHKTKDKFKGWER
jgi:hypothetical protein